MPSLNQILYNVYSDGTNLYGKEPAHFYIVNLLLNFNIIANLGLMSPLLFVLSPIVKEKDLAKEEMERIIKEADLKPKKKNKAKKNENDKLETNEATEAETNEAGKGEGVVDDAVECVGLIELCAVLCGMYCWIGVSSMQPHKEERFLAFVYPSKLITHLILFFA